MGPIARERKKREGENAKNSVGYSGKTGNVIEEG